MLGNVAVFVCRVGPGLRSVQLNTQETLDFERGHAMFAVRQVRATLDDLYRTPGKAELVRGRLLGGLECASGIPRSD